jgi:hypothetical protein
MVGSRRLDFKLAVVAEASEADLGNFDESNEKSDADSPGSSERRPHYYTGRHDKSEHLSDRGSRAEQADVNQQPSLE